MLGSVCVFTYLQGLLVQLLSVAVLLPLDVDSSQLVKGASNAGVVWV